ncbi:hypothetical protein B9Q03_11435 [Candidatus Marsarchaeota G2 archaeon OSP_D]|uniref:Uncharacterized protein n=1 Tax=Candidatus Marsarchaeota G2 archaeon OSP_D TaxID=1978157 RepID=A0A2R6AKS3_9ARCH|nr:MAG: hypothetical protein B9Q03_11435 [Candidatus Marsarchaeota G2 archaeon OSP_D]
MGVNAVAYFIDGLGDLLKEMFNGMNLKELTKKALDKKLPVEVRLKVVDLMLSFGEDSISHLEKVAKKADTEIAEYAGRKLRELGSSSQKR